MAGLTFFLKDIKILAKNNQKNKGRKDFIKIGSGYLIDDNDILIKILNGNELVNKGRISSKKWANQLGNLRYGDPVIVIAGFTQMTFLELYVQIESEIGRGG